MHLIFKGGVIYHVKQVVSSGKTKRHASSVRPDLFSQPYYGVYDID